MVGVKRFLQKVENLFQKIGGMQTEEQIVSQNKFIRDIKQRVPEMRLNTSIARMMEYVNEMSEWQSVPRENYSALIKQLSLFAPHFSEEIWEMMGNKTMLAETPADTFDETKCVSNVMTVVVSVNGKRRAEISMNTTASEDEITTAAKSAVQKFITSDVKRVVYIPNKMVNFVL
jgi:leucyl-tRNA synthetase